MRHQRNLAVIHLKSVQDDHVFSIQQRVLRAMAAGRNVVLVCDTPLVHRMQRLTLATLGVRNLPGRFAIVSEEAAKFSETIPATIRERLRVFPTQIDAIDWIDPNPEDEEATLMDLSMS